MAVVAEFNWIERGLAKKGSAKSGNWGHAGRPGKRGGSAPRKKGFGTIVGGGIPSQEAYDNSAKINQEILNRRLKTYDQGSEELANKSGLPINDVQDTIDQWNYTASDNHPPSIAIQEAATKEFDVPMSEYVQGKLTVPGASYNFDEGITGDQKLLRTMYNETQSDLRRMGIGPDDKIALTRGVTLKKGYAESVGARVGEDALFYDNPLGSWSTEIADAEWFARRGTGPRTEGWVVEASIPAKNILSFAGKGFGEHTESELVIIGGSLGVVGSVEEIK